MNLNKNAGKNWSNLTVNTLQETSKSMSHLLFEVQQITGNKPTRYVSRAFLVDTEQVFSSKKGYDLWSH